MKIVRTIIALLIIVLIVAGFAVLTQGFSSGITGAFVLIDSYPLISNNYTVDSNHTFTLVQLWSQDSYTVQLTLGQDLLYTINGVEYIVPEGTNMLACVDVLADGSSVTIDFATIDINQYATGGIYNCISEDTIMYLSYIADSGSDIVLELHVPINILNGVYDSGEITGIALDMEGIVF